jgi:hypothetical protein
MNRPPRVPVHVCRRDRRLGAAKVQPVELRMLTLKCDGTIIHRQRRMTKPRLNGLQGQFKAAIRFAVDAPAGVEMAKRMKPGVFRRAIDLDRSGGDLRRSKSAFYDVAVRVDRPDARRED